MTDRASILDQLFQAIDEVNLSLPPEKQVARGEQTRLAGGLDSLAYLNLIVAAEEKICASFHASIPLASMLMESAPDQLPRNIGDLADLIGRLLKDHGHE
jgi:acyl carrier protein